MLPALTEGQTLVVLLHEGAAIEAHGDAVEGGQVARPAALQDASHLIARTHRLLQLTPCWHLIHSEKLYS